VVPSAQCEDVVLKRSTRLKHAATWFQLTPVVHHPSLRSVWSDLTGLRRVGIAGGSPYRHDPGQVHHFRAVRPEVF
jgi:hypothetical protein